MKYKNRKGKVVNIIDSPIMKYIDTDRFIFFLHWLIDEHNFCAKDIVWVVERPYQYRNRWEEFSKEWGVE